MNNTIRFLVEFSTKSISFKFMKKKFLSFISGNKIPRFREKKNQATQKRTRK